MLKMQRPSHGEAEASSSACLERESIDGNRRALFGPVFVVQVVEASAEALIEDSRPSE